MQNSSKVLQFDDEARAKLLIGVDILADAVKLTMGPRGRNVVIERPNATPILTKDGVTVARSVNLRDKFPNLGVQMIKEAAARTADVAGDGTTTATVLSQAIFTEGLKMIAARSSAVDLKKGIDIAVEAVIESLKAMATQITDNSEIEQVGTISANGEKEIGRLLAKAVSQVGRDGVITVEEAKGFHTSLSVVEGMQIKRGFVSPFFVSNQDKMTAELENPLILVSNKKFHAMPELLPLLEKVLHDHRSLLIIADEVDNDAMQGLVVNKLKGILNVCVIRAPGFGESRIGMLDDLGILLDTEVISNASGHDFKTLPLSVLGTCKKVTVTRTTTTFVNGAGSADKVTERVSGLREQMEDPTLDQEEREYIQSRISKLMGGVAVLHVGGATEVELRERKDRVDDALNATQAAVEEGIVPGGGVALVRAAQCLDNLEAEGDVALGIDIIRRSCQAPLRQIVINAGKSPDVVLDRVSKLDKSFGYDAYNDEFRDMLEAGIIDPVKVVRSALENAASVAGMMLTVGCVMIEDEETTHSAA
tara:strand:- start:8230 stop:9834 length:1605 start_codon:yes stop_codon:yes gene_type:complete